ncbi:Hypothetical_protein [Hexamita inflata]|uniref:Hypothetical_protein n=1 Tax=Hexamita inflata TaxID=28002 RepID=A0AA86RCE7_9EUKA|nr:Hypothetical protein HINF_LOCUS58207 [Hexamita inflata]
MRIKCKQLVVNVSILSYLFKFCFSWKQQIIVITLKQYGARMQSNSSVLVKRTDLVISGYGSYYLQNLQIYIFKRITKILSRLKFNNLAYYLLKKSSQYIRKMNITGMFDEFKIYPVQLQIELKYCCSKQQVAVGSNERGNLLLCHCIFINVNFNLDSSIKF